MNAEQILTLLRDNDPACLEELCARANAVRRKVVGDAVHLRGLIEFSNRCSRNCLYCGLRAANQRPPRYQMTTDEVSECAREATRRSYGTVVLQSGECEDSTVDWLAETIRTIKGETPLAVTLSVGERSYENYRIWHEAGADRVLLRFETSDRELYSRIHPGLDLHRLDILPTLREIGYEIGSGVMVGIPGQSFESLANDIRLFAELDLDMIGLGPYIPNPDTPLDREYRKLGLDSGHVPNSPEMTCKVLALARILCPEANIPASTALATVSDQGYTAGLRSGANVIMPRLTPAPYREMYDIYPSPNSAGDEDHTNRAVEAIRATGRHPGTGQGPRLRHTPG